MTDSWSWSDVEQDITPRIRTVDLCLDGEVQQQLEDAERRLRETRTNDSMDSGTSQVQTEVDELRQRARQATRSFEVQAVSHRRWRELLTEHPSDDPGKRYDSETFLPAAFAECIVQFDNADQVVRALDRLTTGQVTKLFNAIRELNEGDDQVPLPRGR